MTTRLGRRGFLLGGISAAIAMNSSKSAWAVASSHVPFHLGVATYSLREFRRDFAIRIIQQLGVQHVDIKEYHLPYNDTPAELAAGRKRFDSAGLTVVGGGTISLQKDNDADMRRYFEYAKTVGFPMMVIAPTHETLPRVEKFVKEYNIKVAIHNHGTEDKQFPTPQSVLAAVKNMDPRVGLCIDLGHTARTGKDVVESVAEAGPRLFELHIKDLKDFGAKESQCIVGQGIMPIPAIFHQLAKQSYTGTVSLEYEIDEFDPAPGMAQSFAYMRGVLADM